MSAFMVGREHIAYLVSAAQKMAHTRYGFKWYWKDESFKMDTCDRDQAGRVGQMLWDANLESINARDPDTVGKPVNIPGRVGETYIYAHSRPWRMDEIGHVQLFKAIQCLMYQSCEYAGWETSQALAFLRALSSATIHNLPGYDDAAWEIKERAGVR